MGVQINKARGHQPITCIQFFPSHTNTTPDIDYFVGCYGNIPFVGLSARPIHNGSVPDH